MSAVLVASASAFLRMSLVRQLRQRPHVRTLEAASAVEAMRMIAESAVDFAIVDETLLAAPAGERFAGALKFDAERTVLIATSDAALLPPAARASFRVIDGVIEGVLNMGAIARALPQALDDLASAARPRPPPGATAPGPRERVSSRPPEVILMAASTGGPTALAALLRGIGEPHLPIVIAQHMPQDQTAGFARHLAAETGLEVAERGSGIVPPAPLLTVLRGGADYRLGRSGDGRLRLMRTSVESNVFHPSADLLFGSAAEAGVDALAVVLSGMGEDGAQGAAALAARGGRVLVQEFASCVVAGMPSAAYAACPSASVASLGRIADHLAQRMAASGRAAGGGAEG
jgi:two-component system chemotaxis response regulator CheB